MPRLPVRTNHCRFCNHLLLATTRDIASLPRRKAPAQDAAIILPLPVESPTDVDVDATDPGDQPEPEPVKNLPETQAGDKPSNSNRNNDEGVESHQSPSQAQTQAQAQNQLQLHYTILLSTTIPDRKPTLVRREDGFEKRLLLRCGRCRVVVGYFLDPVQFPTLEQQQQKEEGEDGEGEGQGEDRAKVVYILPGAVVETDQMGDEDMGKAMDGEWGAWVS